MQHNQEQHTDDPPQAEFSSLRVIFTIAILFVLMIAAVKVFEVLDKPTTVRTYSNGYSSTTTMEGPFGKTECRTVFANGQAVTTCK